MNIVSILIGIALVVVCTALMIWGQKYLGEKAGRKGDSAGKDDPEGAIENPCKNCGSCPEKTEK